MFAPCCVRLGLDYQLVPFDLAAVGEGGVGTRPASNGRRVQAARLLRVELPGDVVSLGSAVALGGSTYYYGATGASRAASRLGDGDSAGSGCARGPAAALIRLVAAPSLCPLATDHPTSTMTAAPPASVSTTVVAPSPRRRAPTRRPSRIATRHIQCATERNERRNEINRTFTIRPRGNEHAVRRTGKLPGIHEVCRMLNTATVGVTWFCAVSVALAYLVALLLH